MKLQSAGTAITFMFLLVGCSGSLSTDLVDANSSEDTGTPQADAFGEAQAETPHDVVDGSGAASSEDVLSIGSRAPSVLASYWIKGEPVGTFAPDQIYVVEFWATWCPPCRDSMPHLSALQDEYGDAVRFLGFSDEAEETVAKFLGSAQSEEKTWDQVVTYSLALDDERATYDAYMSASGQRGIPTAFIVGRDGFIEWIGHPMQMDQPLRAVVDDQWDRAEAREAYELAARAQRAREQANALLGRAMRNKDWDAALAALEPILTEFPSDPGANQMKMRILQLAGRTEELQQLQTEMVDTLWEDALQLNAIAWNIATGEEPRDLQVALRAAQRANELTEASNGAILDTLARVHYELGDLETAISLQKQALEANPEMAQIKDTLQDYEAEQQADRGDVPSAETDPEPTDAGGDQDGDATDQTGAEA